MRDNSRKVSPLEINGAKIVLRRNFSGDVIVTKSGSWNQEGRRTFNIELDQELADMLVNDLWSVKQYENQDHYLICNYILQSYLLKKRKLQILS